MVDIRDAILRIMGRCQRPVSYVDLRQRVNVRGEYLSRALRQLASRKQVTLLDSLRQPIDVRSPRRRYSRWIAP
jgi:hypothetical protein